MMYVYILCICLTSFFALCYCSSIEAVDVTFEALELEFEQLISFLEYLAPLSHSVIIS